MTELILEFIWMLKPGDVVEYKTGKSSVEHFVFSGTWGFKNIDLVWLDARCYENDIISGIVFESHKWYKRNRVMRVLEGVEALPYYF